ncbi:MAG: response regulator [Ardenticatenaceae bacterium]|nr:response regulator [Ardenticatenaceae bacterium]
MNTSVLIVDDETVTRHMLKMLLELSGFVIDEAKDGLEALEKVKQRIPDAMILDVMMPRLDGITTCERLRANPDTADLFIIMLSGGNDYDRGMEAGASLFMEKPMNADRLIHTLKSLPRHEL